jgi:uncharacterized Zn finger protein
MSEVRTFFRHCPACGRRFEIRVVRREPEESNSYESEIPQSDTDSTRWGTLTPIILSQDAMAPVVVEEKDFSYTYKCKHCGHQWTEIHGETHVESQPKGYTGD